MEPAERNGISIGSMHIPLRALPACIAELLQDQLIVVTANLKARANALSCISGIVVLPTLLILPAGMMGLIQSEKQNWREWDEHYES